MTEPQLIAQDELDAPAPGRLSERAEALFQAHHRAICVRTDRLLAGWLVAQWAAALVLALALTFHDRTVDAVPASMRMPLALRPAARSACCRSGWRCVTRDNPSHAT